MWYGGGDICARWQRHCGPRGAVCPPVGGRWYVVCGGKAASNYQTPSGLPHTTYHLPHTLCLALSLWFCVDIYSEDLGEGFSNPKLKFFCDVMHAGYG